MRLLTVLIASTLALGCGHAPPKTQQEPANQEETSAQLFKRGQTAIQAGDFVRAEQYLTLALADPSFQRPALKLLIHACIQSGHLWVIVNQTEAYLRSHPDDDTLRYLLATTEETMGHRAEAMKHLRLILSHDPSYVDAHYLIGILKLSEAPDESLHHFETCLTLAPQGPHAQELKGRIAELQLLHSSDEARPTAIDTPVVHPLNRPASGWFETSNDTSAQ